MSRTGATPEDLALPASSALTPAPVHDLDGDPYDLLNERAASTLRHRLLFTNYVTGNSYRAVCACGDHFELEGVAGTDAGGFTVTNAVLLWAKHAGDQP